MPQRRSRPRESRSTTQCAPPSTTGPRGWTSAMSSACPARRPSSASVPSRRGDPPSTQRTEPGVRRNNCERRQSRRGRAGPDDLSASMEDVTLDRLRSDAEARRFARPQRESCAPLPDRTGRIYGRHCARDRRRALGVTELGVAASRYHAEPAIKGRPGGCCDATALREVSGSRWVAG